MVKNPPGTDSLGSVQHTLTDEPVVSTNQTIFSAHVGTNAELFPKVLQLHVDRGAKIADVTYGNGTFWKRVPTDVYEVVGTDIDAEKSPTDQSVDCRELPYSSNSFDVVVLDPPYASGLLRETSRAGQGSHNSFQSAYTSESEVSDNDTGHDAVRNLYKDAGREASRVLRDEGVLIVKTQDEVVANTNEFTHIQITEDYREFGLTLKDLFVLIRQTDPNSVGVENQVHARKNHSYFMVFEK